MTHLNLSPEDINWYFPIYGVTAYGRVIVVHRACRFQPPKNSVKGNRKKIKASKKKSLDFLVFKVSTCDINWISMATLTYGQNYPLNGRRVKSDVNHFLTIAKRSFGEFSYFWFLEFQTRGAPHIHIVWTLDSPDDCQRNLFATLWSNIVEEGNWPYTEIKSPFRKRDARIGMSTQDSVFRQHRRAVVWSKLRKQDGAIRYALMYAAKEAQKRVPQNFRDVGRFWSTSRDVKPKGGVQVPVKESDIRLLLDTFGRDFSKWPVLPKLIFHSGNLPQSEKTL